MLMPIFLQRAQQQKNPNNREGEKEIKELRKQAQWAKAAGLMASGP